MRIVLVSTYYSTGMGYTENCLPAALAARGHDVHVITSSLNVYGDSEEYQNTYASFLGAADQGVGRLEVDGYTVHRLGYRMFAGYVSIPGIAMMLRELRPEIVHSTAIASLQSYKLAALQPLMGFKLFTENHQHLSVVKPFLKQRGHWARKAVYRVTRTLPGRLVSAVMERCYAVAPDCFEVAKDLYGVPSAKLKLQSLGTDTTLFRPAESPEEVEARGRARRALGYREDDVLCVYTGRFSAAKNPLALALAVDRLAESGAHFHGIFVGEGEQHERILRCQNTRVMAFMRHVELAELYRLADIAVWPRQESMSMLDAASSGLPIVVSADIGESERVVGNGMFYAENNVGDLARVLGMLASPEKRQGLGEIGRQKMCARFSWAGVAAELEADYRAAVAGGKG